MKANLSKILTITVVCVVILLVLSIIVIVAATRPDEDRLEYTLSADKTYYTVKDVKNTYKDGWFCKDELTIPATHDGLPVKSIKEIKASGIKHIIISEGISQIEKNAFSDSENSGITHIELPSSLSTIGAYAFDGCSGLEDIIVNEGNSVYTNNDGCLVEKDTGTLLFACKSKAIPSDGSIRIIASRSYSSCSGITSLVVPESVTTICDQAFSGFTELESITIPSTVTSIGANAFSNTKWYNNQDDGLVYAGYVAYKFKGKLTRATNIVLKDDTVAISPSAFSGCTNLSSIKLSDSIVNIGAKAFEKCKKLTTISLSSSVSHIGDDVFSECSSLKAIDIDSENETYVGYDGIVYERASKDIVCVPNAISGDIAIIDGVTTISVSTFSGCKNIKSVTIPDTVTEIKARAFQNCIGLTSITIPASVKNIVQNAFTGCEKLVEVINHSELNIVAGEDNKNGNVAKYAKIVHDGESMIDNQNGYSFISQNGIHYLLGYNGDEKNLVLPQSYNENAYEIYKYAFANNSNITSVVIPEGINVIGNSAFSSCISLNSVSFPNSLVRIEASAFASCRNIISVTLPENLEVIEKNAFSSCTKLLEVINKSKLTLEAKKTSNGSVAKNNGVIIHNGESKIDSIDGYQFITINGTNYLIGYTGASTELILPQGYKGNSYEVYDYAFYNNSNITSVTVPDGITSIGSYAFAECSSIAAINLSNYISKIGASAFLNCSSLENIVLPDALTTIEASLLEGCSGLMSVSLPEGITKVKSKAFYNCSSLTQIEFKGYTEQWESIDFENKKWYEDNTGEFTIKLADNREITKIELVTKEEDEDKE